MVRGNFLLLSVANSVNTRITILNIYPLNRINKMESKCNSPTFRYVSAGAGGRSLDIRENQKVECFNCRDNTAQTYNRSVFCKDLIFCSECNSESENYGRALWTHNMRDELFKKLTEKEKDMKLCSNCFSNSNQQYNRTIYWRNYAFCSGRCQYDFEFTMRKGK